MDEKHIEQLYIRPFDKIQPNWFFEKVFLPRISNSTFQRKIQHMKIFRDFLIIFKIKLVFFFPYFQYIFKHSIFKNTFWKERNFISSVFDSYIYRNLLNKNFSRTSFISSIFHQKESITIIIARNKWCRHTGHSTISRRIFVSTNFLSPLVSSNFNSTTVPQPRGRWIVEH